jgi:outer membrane lipoprotein SlyB
MTTTRTPASLPLALLLATAALAGGCATQQQPVVYQKAVPSAAQQQRVQADAQTCRARAEAAVGINQRRQASKPDGAAVQGAARVGLIGFAATAVGGLVASSKDVWQRARAGAAAGVTGAATKTVLEWNDPDKVFLEYVERCMEDRGHEVLGWR